MVPVGEHRYFLNTETCIRMVHEIKTIPTRPPSRNDSMVGRPSNAEIAPWQTLFGFTAADAELELLNHRATLSTHEARPDTVAKWPWERCRALGFDTETYNYWLRMTEQHRLLSPHLTANCIHQTADSWALFVLMPVDRHISRLKYAPEIKRETGHVFHTVHDHRGFQRTAIVLRA